MKNPSRTVQMPRGIVEPRLIPGTDDADLADVAWIGGDIPRPGEVAVKVKRLDDDSFLIREDHSGRAKQYREMWLKFSSQDPETTTFEISVTLGGIAPIAWWEFWTRPFAEDYCEHLVARLTGTRDGSIYGRLTKRLRRKVDKKRARLQSV